MARSYYQNEFVIGSASGEAIAYFGNLAAGAKPQQCPKLAIRIKADNAVEFGLRDCNGTLDFCKAATGRFMGCGDANWCEPKTDFIVGHLNVDVPGQRQLFLMWVRIEPQPVDPEKYLTLGMFIVKNASSLSGGEGGLFGLGTGQEDGGGSGSGPNHA